MKKYRLLEKDDLKMIKAPALAEKHSCSEVYVRSVLVGNRGSKTLLAKSILRDANDILAVFSRNTSDLVKSKK